MNSDQPEPGMPWIANLDATIAALRSPLIDDLASQGLSVEGTFEEADDPVLIGRDGKPVETWRESHPYQVRVSREEYEYSKRLLQIELLKAQTWIADSGERLVIGFDGRDAAGKGSTIKRFIEHLNPRSARVVALPAPGSREQGQWFFQRYVNHLPTAGEIVLFDRSWYNRAVVEPVMGFCSPQQHEEFMRAVPLFEEMLVNDGIRLIKLWFSVTRLEQITRFTIRRIDPVRQWKLSPMDLASLDRWEDYTEAKNEMFLRTHHRAAPWTIVRSNDKKRGRLEALRYVLSQIPYPSRDDEIVGTPDPLIVGPPDQ